MLDACPPTRLLRYSCYSSIHFKCIAPFLLDKIKQEKRWENMLLNKQIKALTSFFSYWVLASMLAVFNPASLPSLAVWLHNANKKRDVDTQRHKALILWLNCLIYINMWKYCSSCSPFEERKEGRKEKILRFSRQAVRSGADRTAALLPGGCDSFPTTVQWQCMTSTDPDRTRFTSAGLN